MRSIKARYWWNGRNAPRKPCRPRRCMSGCPREIASGWRGSPARAAGKACSMADAMRSEKTRQEYMRDFLSRSGWGEAAIAPLPADASTRRYARLFRNGKTAMLMDQPQAAEAPVAPADADAQARHALGYNAVARL